ncbi:MAG TPA: MoaD/ThiS family protein [Chthoniobacterales bacterium]|jgi:molybdopterin converting factor small subunit|nr:MoaD/ThiS family protein [Chthoniobacterales bacterium]
MKVRVQLFSHLRNLAGASQLDVELAEGATVADLLTELYQRFPVLRAHDKAILTGAGMEFVDRAHKLHAAEEIAVMPPVQGG